MRRICYNGSIGTILEQLSGSKKALSLGMALFIVGGALVSNLPHNSLKDAGILGGPASATAATAPEEASLVASGQLSSLSDPASPLMNTLGEASLEASSPISLNSKNVASAATTAGILDPNLDDVPPKAVPAKAPVRLVRYFIQPATGINWGILHQHNAVDIANACGTPVVAAASGIVTEAQGDGSWNGGYGNYIEIEHPNGTRTKYAHLQSLTASTGDQVSQGAQIATIGNTGHVTGTTGCHLHFEVAGAANPFARR